MSADTTTSPKHKGGWWSLSPLAVFLCLYLITSLLVNDFYKVPITVAFLLSSCYAIAITRGLKLEQRVYQFSVGAGNKNILLMIWIFVLAGAFAQSAKQMGATAALFTLVKLSAAMHTYPATKINTIVNVKVVIVCKK